LNSEKKRFEKKDLLILTFYPNLLRVSCTVCLPPALQSYNE
jgi:hypothetical protein